MSLDPATISGSIGAVLVLLAFIQNQRNRWQNTELRYDLINAVGSVFLFLSAMLLGSLPFMVTNSVWGLWSLRDVFLKIKNTGNR